MRGLALVSALAACGGPTVLSSFGARCAVHRSEDGACIGRSKPHDGADIGPADVGDPVIASADGVVQDVLRDDRYGTEVIILHDGAAHVRPHAPVQYRTGYLHLSRALVQVGDHVRRGDRIGEVGLFWGSFGIVHVHWRLWANWRAIDPEPMTVGCFDHTRSYSEAAKWLELTYPLEC